MELTFLTTVHIVLWFALIARIALVSHKYLSILYPTSPKASRLGVGKMWGRDITRLADLKQPKGYPIPCYVTLSNESWEEEGTMIMKFCPPKHLICVLRLCFPKHGWTLHPAKDCVCRASLWQPFSAGHGCTPLEGNATPCSLEDYCLELLFRWEYSTAHLVTSACSMLRGWAGFSRCMLGYSRLQGKRWRGSCAGKMLLCAGCPETISHRWYHQWSIQNLCVDWKQFPKPFWRCPPPQIEGAGTAGYAFGQGPLWDGPGKDVWFRCSMAHWWATSLLQKKSGMTCWIC